MFVFPFPGSRHKGDDVLSGMKFYESAMTDWAQMMTAASAPIMKATVGGMPANPVAAGAAMATLGFAVYGHMMGMMVGATTNALNATRRAPSTTDGALGRFDGLNPLPDIEQVKRYVADSLAGTPLAPWTEPKPQTAPKMPAKPKVVRKPAEPTAVERLSPPVSEAALAPVAAPEPAVTAVPTAKLVVEKPKGKAAAKPATPKPAARKAPSAAKAKPAAAVADAASDIAKPVAASETLADVAVAEPVALARPAPATRETVPAIAATKPAGIERPETPDDLKRIDGIGPKLEKVLNEQGLWTYAQLASLTPENLAWLDAELGLGGRATRDGWTEAASRLANPATGE